jgi:hypothetical protein
MTTMTKTDTIRELNDQFRRTFGGGGKRLMTAGVAALPFADQAAIIGKVMEFDNFTEDNDPHGEHDFGSFMHRHLKVFWKIDSYDQAIDLESPEPPAAEDLARVLTIMLADEY